MDMNVLHDITFYVMYAAMAIAIFIAIAVHPAIGAGHAADQQRAIACVG